MSNIIPPGYLRWDGKKYVFDNTVQGIDIQPINTLPQITWNGDSSGKRSYINSIGSLSTTNNTPTSLALINVDGYALYEVDLIVMAVNAAASTRAVYKVSAVVYGNMTTNSPIATLDGSAISNGTGTSSGSLAATVTVNGSTGINLQVTGAAATNITWGYEARISKLIP
jgi:hypothetical protein